MKCYFFILREIKKFCFFKKNFQAFDPPAALRLGPPRPQDCPQGVREHAKDGQNGKEGEEHFTLRSGSSDGLGINPA